MVTRVLSGWVRPPSKGVETPALRNFLVPRNCYLFTQRLTWSDQIWHDNTSGEGRVLVDHPRCRDAPRGLLATDMSLLLLTQRLLVP